MNDVQNKYAIYEVLCNYCRGLDRMDKALAYSVWHADGTALYHDLYEGSGRGFVDWVWQAHAQLERHSHQIANHIIQVDGDTARSETYVTATLWTLPDENDQQLELIAKSRYLDRWSKHDGKWAIDHREHVLDMQSINLLQRGQVNAQSTRDVSDASFSLFNTN